MVLRSAAVAPLGHLVKMHILGPSLIDSKGKGTGARRRSLRAGGLLNNPGVLRHRQPLGSLTQQDVWDWNNRVQLPPSHAWYGETVHPRSHPS